MFIQFTQGLFSRITFREPVFLGGTGNITGLAKRLPVADGMTGCIRKFVANEHEYVFTAEPTGDITHGFDIRKYCVIVFHMCTYNIYLNYTRMPYVYILGRKCELSFRNYTCKGITHSLQLHLHVNAIEELNIKQKKHLLYHLIKTLYLST